MLGCLVSEKHLCVIKIKLETWFLFVKEKCSGLHLKKQIHDLGQRCIVFKIHYISFSSNLLNKRAEFIFQCIKFFREMIYKKVCNSQCKLLEPRQFKNNLTMFEDFYEFYDWQFIFTPGCNFHGKLR